ncbi:MAG: hypothetical protein ACKERG_03970 [Candidatus Hodgkinia cicadicola]
MHTSANAISTQLIPESSRKLEAVSLKCVHSLNMCSFIKQRWQRCAPPTELLTKLPTTTPCGGLRLASPDFSKRSLRCVLRTTQ